ncbi:MAG: adenylyltransferase/cytidyltransferase family protein [Desulfarculales bacterium]|nr:adenylyltransferase/cytidyltransferase family protein [Desulfarculales bacterium]
MNIAGFPLHASHSQLLANLARYRNKFSLAQVLRKNGVSKVALYGGGATGLIIYEMLIQGGLEVKFIFDRKENIKFPYPVPVFHPDRWQETPGVDMIIVTASGYRAIYHLLRRTGIFPRICSLHSLIIDVDMLSYFYQAVGHLRKSGASLLLFNSANALAQVRNPSSAEALCMLNVLGFRSFYADIEHLFPYFDDLPLCSKDYIQQIMFTAAPRMEKNGLVMLADYQSEYINVINHRRLTTGVPDRFDHTVYIFGDCWAAGFAAADNLTIASQLQAMLANTNFNSAIYRVQNCGVNAELFLSSLKRILQEDFAPGDIAVCSSPFMPEMPFYYPPDRTVRYHTTERLFDRPHNLGEIFIDSIHINHRGYKLVAEKLHHILGEEFLSLPRPAPSPAAVNSASQDGLSGRPGLQEGAIIRENTALPWAEEINAYLAGLTDRKPTREGVNGCVVINANPFTLGHRRLAVWARQHCDFLYVFVVEEDLSFFPFAQRLEMVKRGLADLSGVMVLSGGKFIISALTLPEYFSKEEATDIVINPALDLELFAAAIAPALGISKRFAGQEPLCQLTRQYNQAMAEVLPKYGIEFVEFERFSIGAMPVSASRARALLAQGDFNGLKELVPGSTYEFLSATLAPGKANGM